MSYYMHGNYDVKLLKTAKQRGEMKDYHKNGAMRRNYSYRNFWEKRVVTRTSCLIDAI